VANKRILFGVAAGAISLGIDGIAGLLLFRLLARYLPPETSGFWILVTTTGSLLQLLQCGLGPSVARRVAQASAVNDPAVMEQTVATVRKALTYVVGAVIFGSLLLYPAQLASPANKIDHRWQAATAWFIYAASIGLNLFGQGYLFVLNGLGHVGWDKVLRIFTSTAAILATWSVLSMGHGIVALSIIQLIVNAAFLAAARAKLRGMLPGDGGIAKSDTNLFRELFAAGFKLLVLNLLGFTVTNFGLLATERRFGLAVLTPFAAMFKIGALLTTFAGLVSTMSYPYVSKHHAQGEKGACRKYYLYGVAASLLIYAVLGIPTYLFGQLLFDSWLGKGQYLGNYTFGLVLVFNAILANHTAHSMPVLAVAGNAFMVPAIVNGILVVALTLILPTHFGLNGIPLAMILGTVFPSAFVVHVAVRQFLGFGSATSHSRLNAAENQRC
jgi:O-antigen/teichoic acid export membrane protein